MVCPGCGLGWSKDCDVPYGFPCGCGAWHDHDSTIKHKCIPMYWPDGRLAK